MNPNPFCILLSLEPIRVGYRDRLCEITLKAILVKPLAIGRLVRVLRLHNGNAFNFPCA